MSTILIAMLSMLSLGVIVEQGRGVVAKVEVAPATAETGQQISITVSGTNPCGAVHIITGDGAAVTHAITALPSTHAHAYRKPGNYTIVAQGMGNCDGEARATIAITGQPLDPEPPPPPRPSPPPPPRPEPPPPPRAEVTRLDMSPAPGLAGEPVTFALEGQGACEVSLEFGDGNTRRLRGDLPHRTTHTYGVPGRYTVIARPLAPCEGRHTQMLEVVQRPAAGQIGRVTIAPDPAAAGEPVTIRVEGTGACGYDVDFGDGNREPRDGNLPATMTRYYHRAGLYTVTAAARAPCRGSGRVTFEVRDAVRESGGITGIDLATARPIAGTQLAFTLRGSGECRVTFDFGDGNRRTHVGRLPLRVAHVYETAGRFTVDATADQPCGGGARLQVDVRAR